MTYRLLSGARRISWALCGQLLIALPAHGAPAPAEKAAAEALFNEGAALMAAKNFSAACAKFEASSVIEPGLGVKLWLADCYDRVGRSASAWALFTEAAALAQQSGQSDRERAASERASDLEARLSKLELKVPAEGLPEDLVVTLNGVAIPSASLGSALPVDPGLQRVALRAPGYQTVGLAKEVPVGPASVSLELPVMKREPAAPHRGTAGPGRRDATPAPGGTQRLLGYTIGGLGLASLGGASFLAYRAHSLDKDSRTHCLVEEPNACDADGASLREQARNFGNVATGVFIAGGALTATGIVLLLTTPSVSHGQTQVGLAFTRHGGTIAATGTF